MASESDHQSLQAPAGTEITPAVAFLRTWLSYFVECSNPDYQKHKATASDFADFYDRHFLPDAVVEFPYLPRAARAHFPVQALTTEEADGGRLVGREQILSYFAEWRSMFWFGRGDVKTLAGFLGNKAVIEAKLTGKLFKEDQITDYVQDYVSFVEVDDAGKAINYREHWAMDRFQ